MKVIIFYEKHGIRVFPASTEEELYNSCAKIVKERNKINFYYIGDEAELKLRLQKYENDIQILESFRNDTSKLLLDGLIENLKTHIKEIKHRFKEINLIKQATISAYNAYLLIDAHGNYEYERFEICEVES